MGLVIEFDVGLLWGLYAQGNHVGIIAVLLERVGCGRRGETCVDDGERR